MIDLKSMGKSEGRWVALTQIIFFARPIPQQLSYRAVHLWQVGNKKLRDRHETLLDSDFLDSGSLLNFFVATFALQAFLVYLILDPID